MKILLTLFLSISLNLIGQELPKLNVREEVTSENELPEKLETNEIGVIIKLTGGWSAYNNIGYYIFKNDGNVIAYSKKAPKKYLKKRKELKEEQKQLELEDEKKNELKASLKSKTTLDFLKYAQKDFKKSESNGPPPCGITDATG
ncbi:hypothetical protein ACFQ1Q_02310, partial [Winogradskyella litorisediminis]